MVIKKERVQKLDSQHPVRRDVVYGRLKLFSDILTLKFVLLGKASYVEKSYFKTRLLKPLSLSLSLY